MADEVKNNVEDVVNIPIEKLIKADWNPQVQSTETFNELVAEIESDGFDEPLVVIKHPDKEDRFLIVAGNHRYDAGKVIGMTELPCIIKDWDEEEAKIKAVRRNIIHGDLDERRFSTLVNSIKRREKITEDEVAKKMGFASKGEFDKRYRKEEIEKRAKERKEAYSHDDIPKELQMVDNVTVAVNDIFSNHEGDSIDRSYLFFMYKKKMHLIVTCDDALAKTVSKTVGHINDNSMDAAEFFKAVLEKAVKESSKK